MKEWQKSLVIIVGVPAALLLLLVLYNGSISGGAIDDMTCSGKHNMIVFRDEFKEVRVNSNSNITRYVFTLPENDFKELYRKIQAKSGKALINCTDDGTNPSCDFYVNDEACLTGLPTFPNRAERMYSIDNCTKFFRDGINTLDLREQPPLRNIRLNNIVMLFLETEITPARC